MTAYELLNSFNPPKSIVMLEARELCSAATGRNAGHCKPDQVSFDRFQSSDPNNYSNSGVDLRNTNRCLGLSKLSR